MQNSIVCEIKSHFPNLLIYFQHTLNFLAHGFGTGAAEIYMHPIGGLADFFDKGEAVVFSIDCVNPEVSVLGSFSRSLYSNLFGLSLRI